MEEGERLLAQEVKLRKFTNFYLQMETITNWLKTKWIRNEQKKRKSRAGNEWEILQSFICVNCPRADCPHRGFWPEIDLH